MKQKLFTKIIALALCTAFVPVQADSVRQAEKADELIFSGNSFTPYENIPVTVLAEGVDKDSISALIASGGDISGKILFTGTAVADANGKVEYRIPIGTETAKGVYQVYVAGDMYEVGFERNSDRINLVDTIVNAGDNLPAVLEQNYIYLSVDNKLYKQCSGADAIAAVLKNELEKSPISSATEDALTKLAEMVDKSILTVAANEKKLTSLAQIDEVLSQSASTKAVLGLMDKITEEGKTAILEAFQGNGYTLSEDADKRYAKEIALKAICYPTVKTSTALLEILNGYNSALGLNLVGFNGLSNANRASAIVAFSGQMPQVATMQEVLDSIVRGYNNQTPSAPSGGGGGGGGGGGAGGGGGSHIAPTVPSISSDSEKTEPKEDVFKDLQDVSWAKEAILTLHAKGIISGYGNKEFAPKNNIKREEFIKLVVGAYYPDEKAENIAFKDVDVNAWYYDSVAVAVEKGIVSGMDENNFGTGMNITRQDMAVILHRVAEDKFAVKDEETKFADDSDIAEYAKDAVYALRDAGIINGVSDSEFAPKKNATRAETAVMLYKFMKSFNGGI